MKPAPSKEDPSNSLQELLFLMKTINATMDKNYTEVLSKLYTVKEIQLNLEQQSGVGITSLRLLNKNWQPLENYVEVEIAGPVTEAVDKEKPGIQSRLDEFERRSRLDHQIFYDFADDRTETEQTEQKNLPPNCKSNQPVIPAALRNNTLQAFYDEPTADHPVFTRAHKKIILPKTFGIR